MKFGFNRIRIAQALKIVVFVNFIIANIFKVESRLSTFQKKLVPFSPMTSVFSLARKKKYQYFFIKVLLVNTLITLVASHERQRTVLFNKSGAPYLRRCQDISSYAISTYAISTAANSTVYNFNRLQFQPTAISTYHTST